MQKILVSWWLSLLVIYTDHAHSAELFGGLTVFLTGHEADFLRGRFVAANWDVQDLIKYRDEILTSELLRSQPFKGKIGDGGHFTSDEG